MSEIASAAVEGLRLIADAQSDKAKYDYQLRVREAKAETRSDVSTEVTLAGLPLENYTKREQLEDHPDFVMVTEHKEYLQTVPVPPVPPTEEELRYEREHRTLVAKLTAGVIATGIVVGGVLMAYASRTPKHVPQLP